MIGLLLVQEPMLFTYVAKFRELTHCNLFDTAIGLLLVKKLTLTDLFFHSYTAAKLTHLPGCRVFS